MAAGGGIAGMGGANLKSRWHIGRWVRPRSDRRPRAFFPGGVFFPLLFSSEKRGFRSSDACLSVPIPEQPNFASTAPKSARPPRACDDLRRRPSPRTKRSSRAPFSLSLPPTMSTQELIANVGISYQHVFGDNVEAALDVARGNSSPFHQLSLGLISFLEGAMGQEHEVHIRSLSLLAQAESEANAMVGRKDSNSDILAGRVLAADALSSQAVVHLFLESIVETTKAIYKLNRAHGQIQALSTVVFATPIRDSDSQEEIVANLNQMYLSHTNSCSPIAIHLGKKSTGSSLSFLSWVKPKRPTLRHARSTSTTVPTKHLGVPKSELHHSKSSNDISLFGDTLAVPGTPLSSRPESLRSVSSGVSSFGSDSPPSTPLWDQDHVWTFIIAGTAWGRGIFGLIFSCLPPKIRRLVGWFGFEANRELSLRLLTLASTTFEGPHAAFASITLITYYTLTLQLCGWVMEKDKDIATCEEILDRFETRFPQGSLSALNRAKICNARSDPAAAISILEAAHAKESGFRPAQGFLVFELSMSYLAACEYEKAAASFILLRSLNEWSHPTYILMAAGALLCLPQAARTPSLVSKINNLFTELSKLVGQERILGSAPATEVFIVRRLGTYKAKHAAWVSQGRLAVDSKYWEALKTSPAYELSFMWNVNGSASRSSLLQQQESLTEIPSSDLTPGEILVRSLLLGQIARYLSDLPRARELLRQVLDGGKDRGGGEESWAGSYALFELSVVECLEGDAVEAQGGKDGWGEARVARVEALLDSLLARGAYDMKNRLEARVMTLREQLAKKRTALRSTVPK